jgi:hypothetical protein
MPPLTKTTTTSESTGGEPIAATANGRQEGAMGSLLKFGLGAAAGGLAAMAAAAGLRRLPAPFPPYPDATPELETVPLPDGLPAPVERYFRAAIGDRLPVIRSAVITGSARITLGGVTFPSRIRFTHRAGHDYRHYIESCWFGRPLFKVNESYLDGHGRMELPTGVIESSVKIDSAANLGLWGESLWLPSVLATDPRVRWELIDDHTARLVVPFGEGEDSFVVRFDAVTGLVRWAEALRYRSVSDESKIPWRLEVLGWERFHGMLVPSPAAATWQDQGKPWLVTTLEEIALNVDVTEYIRARGI